jgi:hypothetical protein
MAREWLSARFSLHPANEPETLRAAFMTYVLFRACRGSQSLSECGSYLVDSLRVIDPPLPDVAAVPRLIGRVLDKSRGRSLVRLFRPHATCTSFFNDFVVVSLHSPGVVSARNMVDGQLYTVKVVCSPNLANTNELTVLTTLQHSSLVRYCNFWVDDCGEAECRLISETFCLDPPVGGPSSFLFVQMDRCDGRSLEERLRKLNFFESRVEWVVARQILDAMRYLHSNGFVHRAIATRNMFFDDMTAKLTDFNPALTFPAKAKADSNEFAADVTAFGVLFFELWYPLPSRETVAEMIRSGQPPADWSELFPLQAAIVRMALRPANANKFAVTLLGSKLLPSEERGDDQNLSGVMSAISTGPMSQWKEILDVLFAPSRRAPFRFKEGLREIEGRAGKFAIFCMSQFARVALAFGAKYFDAPVVGPVTLDGAAIDVMMSDGSLHGLRQSVWCDLERFVASSGINSLMVFSHLVVCSQSTHGEPEIGESDMLAFNVVAREGDLEGLWKCVAFVKELLLAIFKDQPIDVTFTHKKLQEQLSKCEPSAGKRQAAERIARLRGRSKDADRALAECKLITDKVAALTNGKVVLVLGRAPEPRTSVRISMTGRLGISAEIRRIDCDNHVVIHLAQICLDQLASLWRAPAKLRPKQIEVIFVITYDPLETDKIRREQYDDTKWQKAFVETQLIAAELRKQDVATSVAPNDGRPANVHRPEVNEMSITMIAIISFAETAKKPPPAEDQKPQIRSMGRGSTC